MSPEQSALENLARRVGRLVRDRERRRIAWWLANCAAYDDCNLEETKAIQSLALVILDGGHDADCDRHFKTEPPDWLDLDD